MNRTSKQSRLFWDVMVLAFPAHKVELVYSHDVV